MECSLLRCIWGIEDSGVGGNPQIEPNQKQMNRNAFPRGQRVYIQAREGANPSNFRTLDLAYALNLNFLKKLINKY